jgi:hypothetical protein
MTAAVNVVVESELAWVIEPLPELLELDVKSISPVEPLTVTVAP